MRLLYRHWKGKTHEYFFYINWVAHDGTKRPILRFNLKHTDTAIIKFTFDWGKFSSYLVKAKL